MFPCGTHWIVKPLLNIHIKGQLDQSSQGRSLYTRQPLVCCNALGVLDLRRIQSDFESLFQEGCHDNRMVSLMI